MRERRQPSPGKGLLRWLRGSVVGGASFGLALTGHLCAGGQVNALTASALGGFVIVFGVALSSRQWRLPSLLAFLSGFQVVFHLIVSASSTPAWDADISSHAGHNMSMAATMDMSGSMDMSPVGGPVDHWMSSPAAMVAFHLAAAVITAVLLCHGEACCWALIGLLLRPLLLLRAPRRPLVVSRRWQPTAAPSPVGCEVLASDLVRRGPPVPRPMLVTSFL
jgi:hypothetical protein